MVNLRLLRFLEKNWLTIVLAILPPAALWWFLQRESFQLTVTVLADLPVVSVELQYGADIQVLYLGRPVASLHAVELEVRNSGNQPLERSAFDTPLTFVFSAEEVTPPRLVLADPPSLKPELRRDSSTVIHLEPVLLNPEDRFVFRTLSLNAKSLDFPLEVLGRVRGVRHIQLRKASQRAPTWLSVLSVLGAVLGAVVSGVSFLRLGKEVRGLTLRFPFELIIDLTKRIEQRVGTAERVRRLAEQLQIKRHDQKARLLLLRMKMESLLRELALKIDLPRRDQLASMGRLTRELEQRGMVPHEVAAAIRDITPSISRELHVTETYLSPEEHEALESLALNVIAALNAQLESLPQGGA